MTSLTEPLRRTILLTLMSILGAQPVYAANDQSAAAANTGSERKPLFTMIPDYPKVARRDRIEGEVQVCFDITRDGRTRRIAVRKSTHRIFEKPAIRAIRASTYEPLPSEARMSGIKYCRTFRFTLEPVVEATDN